jgi:hypothetical protein
MHFVYFYYLDMKYTLYLHHNNVFKSFHNDLDHFH